MPFPHASSRIAAIVGLTVASLGFVRTAAAEELAPQDYAELSHAIAIDFLRAGNHDPSGVNDYYFSVQMFGLLNSSEERNLEFSKRKKLPVDLGTFGDTKIEALSAWRADEKAKDGNKELRVEGNAIRELTARTMSEFKVAEGDVAVMVEITMFEREKKAMFFGEDRRLEKTSYYPIAQTKFDTPPRTNQTLTISDELGTQVKVGIRYDHPAAAATTK